MELILNIIFIAALLLSGIALWQTWQILRKGRNKEKLSEKEVAEVNRWLNLFQVCSGVEVVIVICRIFLQITK